MAVREDHGLDVAVAYAAPGNASYPDNEESLWSLARGLGASFVAGRDEDGDDQRDLTVSEIKRRFDITSTVPISPTRWNIPQNDLRVETFSYPDTDHTAYLAMTETPRILDQFGHDATPTLLFAREEHARNAGLADGAWQNGVLTISAQGQKVETIASLKWAPFRYSNDVGPDDTVIGWEAYPLRDYWDKLELDLKDLFVQLFPDDSDAANLGRAIVARSFYLSLAQGMANQVQMEQAVQSLTDPQAQDSDAALAAGVGVGYGKKIAPIVWDVTRQAYKHYGLKRWYVKMGGGSVDWDTGVVSTWSAVDVREEFHGFWESLGEGIKSNTVAPWMALAETGIKGKVAVGIGLVGAVAVVGLTIYAATQVQGVAIAGTVLTGLGTILAIQGAVSTAVTVVNAAKEAGSLSAAASKGIAEAGSSIKSGVKSAAIVGLIIGVVATWAAFGLQVGLSGGMTGREIGMAVSFAVAATIVAVIMFVIALIPIVGQIIAAVVGLIDSVIGLLCTAVDAALGAYDQEPNAAASQWFCGGLTGIHQSDRQSFLRGQCDGGVEPGELRPPAVL